MSLDEYIEEYKKRYPELKKINEKIWDFIDKNIENCDILEFANKVEDKIRELGAMPAFPINISINEIAAHFTPENSFKIDLEKHMVKVDVGIQIEGFIFDSAKTYYKGEYQNIVETARKAFEESLKEIKSGNKINLPGEIVEEIAKENRLKPIRNLGGHGLGHYAIHTPPSLLNAKFETDEEFISGYPIAWEVFITNGSGYVKDSFPSLIFEVRNINKINLIRVGEIRKILDFAYKNFKTLPFSKRWLKFDKNLVEFAISEGVKREIVYEYPILREEKNSFVAQFETTLIVK